LSSGIEIHRGVSERLDVNDTNALSCIVSSLITKYVPRNFFIGDIAGVQTFHVSILRRSWNTCASYGAYRIKQ
jgi:hypothetical protein